jgi:predicted nucleic acid-binding protein
MLVVADSSPLIVFTNIGHIDVLPALFGQVVIPPTVLAELRQPRRPQAVREFAAKPPAWITERAPTMIDPIPSLHPGELTAIYLAQELKADLLLIDELAGRKVAADRKIPITGTIGVLELAAEKGLLDLHDAFHKVKATDFWISHALLDQRLEQFQAVRSQDKPMA